VFALGAGLVGCGNENSEALEGDEDIFYGARSPAELGQLMESAFERVDVDAVWRLIIHSQFPTMSLSAAEDLYGLEMMEGIGIFLGDEALSAMLEREVMDEMRLYEGLLVDSIRRLRFTEDIEIYAVRFNERWFFT